MPSYAFFNDSGRIETKMVLPRESFAIAQGRSYIECNEAVSDVTHYVFEGALVPRASFVYTQNIGALTVSLNGLPVGTFVSVAGNTLLTDDQPTEIEFELPGTYTVKLSGLVEYLDEELEVTVNG